MKVCAVLELPTSDLADELTLYALACPASCAARFFGIVKERHLPKDSLDAFAFPVKNEKSWKNLLTQFHACTTPQNKNCSCSAHAIFRRIIANKTYEVPGVQLLDTPVALVWEEDDDVIPPYWP